MLFQDDFFKNQYIKGAQSSVFDFFKYLMDHPAKFEQIQKEFLKNQETILKGLMGQDVSLPFKKERIFESESWQESPFHKYIYQSYLNLKTQISATCEQDAVSLKTKFYLNQILEALSPANFVWTNPEIMAKTLETQGKNLRQGFLKMDQDYQDMMTLKTVCDGVFEVGGNLAMTPGDVVFKNDLIELIHYRSQTQKVYEIPILIVPPWINKYYVFDLRPENSFVNWLVSKGYDVYIISWINPKVGHKDVSFHDYMIKGIGAAQDAICAKKVNFLGYCLGGVLLSCYLSYMKDHSSIGVAAFLATPLDFTKSGDLSLFMGQEQMLMMEESLKKSNILDGRILSGCFSLLRSKEMIWDRVVNNYLLDKPLSSLDFLFWNQDVTNLPAQMYLYYVRKFYLENAFLDEGSPYYLGNIACETFWFCAKEDHIAPLQSTLSGLNALKSPFEVVTGQSGHVAGVFNPEGSPKYGFTCQDGDFKGSWWGYFDAWLARRAGGMTAPETVVSLYPAPGKYVFNGD